MAPTPATFCSDDLCCGLARAGLVVGYNSIDGAVIADGEPLEFPPLASGARVELKKVFNETDGSLIRNKTVINVAWHELVVSIPI